MRSAPYIPSRLQPWAPYVERYVDAIQAEERRIAKEEAERPQYERDQGLDVDDEEKVA